MSISIPIPIPLASVDHKEFMIKFPNKQIYGSNRYISDGINIYDFANDFTITGSTNLEWLGLYFFDFNIDNEIEFKVIYDICHVSCITAINIEYKPDPNCGPIRYELCVKNNNKIFETELYKLQKRIPCYISCMSIDCTADIYHNDTLYEYLGG